MHHALGELDATQPQGGADFKREWAVETDREGRDGFVAELAKSLGELAVESEGLGQSSNGIDPILFVRLFDEGEDAGHVHHVSCEFLVAHDGGSLREGGGG